MSYKSDAHPKKVQWMKRTRVAIFMAVLWLPMLGACSQKSTPGLNAGGVTTLRLFDHDTQQASLDLGPHGTGPGKQFLFAGDLFDHAGGRKVGHTAGQCITLTGNTISAGDVFCTTVIVLDHGQIIGQGLSDLAVFGSGQTVPFAIVGGTGTYRNARGDGTIQIPIDVPNRTDANLVINVITG